MALPGLRCFFYCKMFCSLATAGDLCYATGMRRFVCFLLAVAALSAPLSHAAGDNGEKRSWRERGKDLLGAIISPGEDGSGGSSLREGFTQILSEYKEQYKEEGRAYARELGDQIAERVRQNPKISSTLTTVQILCWVVIVYLTLVTVLIVVAMYRMQRDNERILALLGERRGKQAGDSDKTA